MCSRQMLYDCEAQPGAAKISRTGAINSIETFEQSIQMLGRNSLARVGDTYSVNIIPLVIDGDCPTFTIEFDRIVNKVGNHLHQAMRVGKNFCILCHQVLQCDSSLSRSNGKTVHDVLD